MATGYAGDGELLYLTTYSGSAPAVMTQPPQPNIADGSYSFFVPCNDAFSVSFEIVYKTAPSGSTEIEFSTDPTFNISIVIDTIPTSADVITLWSTQAVRQGFLRVHNSSGSIIDYVRVNKVVASTSGF